MKEYSLRFGRNSLNKYGNEETDLYITENFVVRDNTLISNTGEILQNEITFLNAPAGGVGVFKILKSFYFREYTVERKYSIISDITNSKMLFCEVYIDDGKLKFYVHDNIAISSLTRLKAAEIFYNGFDIYVLYGDILSGIYVTKYFKFSPSDSGSSVTITNITTDLPNEIKNPITATQYASLYFLAGGGNILANTNHHLIFYSAMEDPESFSNTDYITVGNNDDKIVKLIVNNGYLYIFKERSIFILSGTGESNFQLLNITNELGLFSTTSICVKNNIIYFFDNMINFRAVSGNDIRMIKDKKHIENAFDFKNFVEVE